MNLRLKRQIEDIEKYHINKNKFKKVYFGKYEADRDESIYDASNIRTFVNYGILTNYCSKHNKIIPPKKMNQNYTCSCDTIKIRVLRNEINEIHDNNDVIPNHLIKKIISREV